MYSWPGVKPRLNGSPPSIIAGTPWRMISMSVAQTAIASTRTSTSAGPGCGTGFSMRASSAGLASTQAFIRWGIGYSLLRDGVSARAVAMLQVLCRKMKFRPTCPRAHDDPYERSIPNRQSRFGYEYANQSPVRLPLPIFSEIPPMPFTKWDDDLGMTAFGATQSLLNAIKFDCFAPIPAVRGTATEEQDA